ncbi:YrhB domain-containing protein [Actinacidiphila yeochonensis]|uniref:YrhB domain-containing protein n=1 Tax=Actinacidiphila yeochonensis TaxID=89050 RepID=UPI000ABF0096|nr:YrhB domain-containing protein [Actinacidiphila yeochonensis]
MIERDAAVRIVEEGLERDDRRWLPAGLDPMRVAVWHVERRELVRIVVRTSEEYPRTRNPDFPLAGNGPFRVDRLDGNPRRTGAVSALTVRGEADYRARVRGQAARTAVDDLHDEVRAVADARGGCPPRASRAGDRPYSPPPGPSST